MKKGTKVLLLTFSSLVIISILIGYVNAAPTAQEAGNSAKQFFVSLGDFFNGLFGQSIPLQKLFLTIILVMVIYSIIEQIFPSNQFVVWSISIVVSILSMMLLSNELINAITIQYGAMGAAILTVIPLIIMLFFTITVKSKLIAKVAWLFYVIYYFFLYIAAWINEGTFWSGGAPYYAGAIIVGLIMFFGAGYFRSLLFEGKLESAEETAIRDIKFRKIGRDVEREEAESRLGKA
jgi:hypothetical protein